jgi:hypothetical protein
MMGIVFSMILIFLAFFPAAQAAGPNFNDTTLRAGYVGRVDVASTPITVTSAQGGYVFTYTNAADGTINLPALSALKDGFAVTIVRQVAYRVTIAANGADRLPGGQSATLLEMRGQNLAAVTLMKQGAYWNLVKRTVDCLIGQSCWAANMIYAGAMNGHQYFVTPGGCTDTSCTGAGGADTLTKKWANNSGTTAYNVNAIAVDNDDDGQSQSATLAGSYTDTEAAQFCESMNYAGYTDWYLPAKAELNLVYQNKAAIAATGGGFVSGGYWSSTENDNTSAWSFGFSNGGLTANGFKTLTAYVRCVRRF